MGVDIKPGTRLEFVYVNPSHGGLGKGAEDRMVTPEEAGSL